MKKVLLVLAALAVAPLCVAGSVNLVATDNSNGTCTITYVTTAGPNPVAMALDVDVSTGGPITAVDVSASFFDIFM